MSDKEIKISAHEKEVIELMSQFCVMVIEAVDGYKERGGNPSFLASQLVSARDCLRKDLHHIEKKMNKIEKRLNLLADFGKEVVRILEKSDVGAGSEFFLMTALWSARDDLYKNLRDLEKENG